MFQSVEAAPKLPHLEERILKFWKKNKIFEKSIEQRSEDNPYSFYDGPPFVTGYPHYGSLLPSIAKDIVPRFFTMKGKRVRRVWGWDCHGLPIENKVEKELGLKNRRDINKYGINKFIEACRKYVEETSSEWKWYVDHVARWVDMDNAYRTMDLKYMESVIWVFKQLYDKGLIYKGVRTSLYCTRCGTPVSNFEIAMDDSYTDMEDPAVTVKFRIISLSQRKVNSNLKGAFLLAWTTTPWTLPSNRALVVKEDEDYDLVEVTGDKGCYIAARKRRQEVFSGREYHVVGKVKGKDLVGLKYEPPYDYFPPNENDFKVYAYEGMVNMDEGTGVVHSAPGFGDIDTQMGKDLGLTIMLAVDDEGRFVPEVEKWSRVYVKEADPSIIQDLRERDLLFSESRIVHRYPYCYRCETPLIHRAQESWFVDVQKLKPELLKTNENINWVPGHFKHGRFKKGIEQAPDWCISRTRYWATVMPVWECEVCTQRKVVGSIKEIEELGGERVVDLHRSGVDHITFECESCGGVMRRVPEVLDCWIESGSMPYAERHYPFENKEDFEKSFPADFIVEYSAQVRAWFYVMHVVSNALMKSHCFKNVVVTGTIMGTDGRKMSKSYGNYPDPRSTIEKYGGDALRLYLLGSPVMMGKDPNMTEGEEIEEKVKTVLLVLWNSYRYFVTYANLHGVLVEELDSWSPSNDSGMKVLDLWIVSRLQRFIEDFETSMEAYNIPAAVNLIQPFVNDLSTWYIRRSRDRFIEGEKIAFKVLYYVLKRAVLVIAPAAPFIAEEIYQNLRSLSDPESVHLCDWPHVTAPYSDEKFMGLMDLVREVVEKGHAVRREAEIKVRQPLAKIVIQYPGGKPIPPELAQLVKDELNVKSLEFCDGEGPVSVFLDTELTEDLILEGLAREMRREIQVLRKNAKCARDEEIVVYWVSDSPLIQKAWAIYGEEIKKQVLAKEIFNQGKKDVDQEASIKLQDEEVWVAICSGRCAKSVNV